jgi:hypothetical protein
LNALREVRFGFDGDGEVYGGVGLFENEGAQGEHLLVEELNDSCEDAGSGFGGDGVRPLHCCFPFGVG